jgi:hypothetical protein
MSPATARPAHHRQFRDEHQGPVLGTSEPAWRPVRPEHVGHEFIAALVDPGRDYHFETGRALGERLRASGSTTTGQVGVV